MLTNDCNFFHQQTQTVEKPHPCKACVKQFGQRMIFFYEQAQLGEKEGCKLFIKGISGQISEIQIQASFINYNEEVFLFNFTIN